MDRGRSCAWSKINRNSRAHIRDTRCSICLRYASHVYSDPVFSPSLVFTLSGLLQTPRPTVPPPSCTRSAPPHAAAWFGGPCALSSARTPRCAASDLQRAPTSFTTHVLTVLDEKQNVLLDTPELISAAARMEAVTGIKSVKLPSKTSNSRLASRSSVRCAHRLGMAERGDLSSEISRKSYFSRFLGQKGVETPLLEVTRREAPSMN